MQRPKVPVGHHHIYLHHQIFGGIHSVILIGLSLSRTDFGRKIQQLLSSLADIIGSNGNMQVRQRSLAVVLLDHSLLGQYL